MKKTITTIALVTMSGSALAQSGLDIDRAYAAELRADANTRSSLLGSSGSALDISVFTQFRYTYDTRSEVNGTALGDNEDTTGFSAPRTQLRLSGGVEGTDITGYLSFDFGGAFDHAGSAAAAGDGGATLREAYAAWGIDDNWTFLFGQFKNPFSAESNVAPEFSQGVERSLTNSFFDMGDTQGIALNYSDDEWKFTAAITDGPTNATVATFGGGAASNSFINSAGESDFSITARLDWLISGTWDQFNDFTSWQGSNTGFRAGAGFNWSTFGNTNPANATAVGSFDTTAFTVDAGYEGDGWGLFASYTSVNTDTSATTDMTNDGFVIQGNMFFTDQLEAFARYDVILLDDNVVLAPLQDTYSTFTVGVNYYLVPESFAARFSADVSFGLDDTSGLDSMGFTDAATTGFLGGAGGTGGTEDDVMVRGQFSILF